MDFLMEREKHENLLSELLAPELEQSRKTEILQELRASHNATIDGVTTLSEKSTKLQRDNDDLIISNSKLFRQTGVVGEQEQEQQQEQDFSETVTIDDLEGGF